MKEAPMFLVQPSSLAALRACNKPDEIILQEWDKIILKRSFWGHRPGTVGRIAALYAHGPRSQYIGKVKLPGSDLASFTIDDINALFTIYSKH